MDFTPVLRNAWRAARGHASGWLMAIVAGGFVGGFSIPSFGGSPGVFQPSVGSPSVPRPEEVFQSWWQKGSSWLAGHLPLLISAAAVAVVVLLVIWVWSITAQGALIWGTMQLARGQQVRRREAWQMGRRLFWRLAGLWLIAFVLGWLALAVAAVIASAVLQPLSAGGLYRAYLVAAASPLIGLWTLVLVPAYIVLAYAKRALVFEDLRLRQALGTGWRTLRRHLGASLLTWIINVAFFFAGLLVVWAVAVVVGGLLTFLAVLVALLVAHALPTGIAGLSGGLVPYVSLAVAVVVALMSLAYGGLNVFLSSYWSEVYMRLNRPHYDPGSIAIG